MRELPEGPRTVARDSSEKNNLDKNVVQFPSEQFAYYIIT